MQIKHYGWKDDGRISKNGIEYDKNEKNKLTNNGKLGLKYTSEAMARR